MKLWLKILIVCVAGSTVWGLSYLTSIYPDMAMMFASINTAVVSVSSFLTGFPSPKEIDGV